MRCGGDRTSSALLRARGLRVRAVALPRPDRAEDQRARSGRPLAGWQLPEEFATLRRLLEARMGKQGKREFVQVLRLMEAFRIEEVTAAVHDAIARGAVGFDAVKHLVLCRIERRPPPLDMTIYPICREPSSRQPRPKPIWVCSREQRHDRYPASAPGAPSQDAQAADVPARVRQGGAPMRRRGRRLSALLICP